MLGLVLTRESWSCKGVREVRLRSNILSRMWHDTDGRAHGTGVTGRLVGIEVTWLSADTIVPMDHHPLLLFV